MRWHATHIPVFSNGLFSFRNTRYRRDINSLSAIWKLLPQNYLIPQNHWCLFYAKFLPRMWGFINLSLCVCVCVWSIMQQIPYIWATLPLHLSFIFHAWKQYSLDERQLLLPFLMLPFFLLILWSSSYLYSSLDKLRLSKQNPEPSLWHPKPIALIFLHRDVSVHVWWWSQHISFLPLYFTALFHPIVNS